MIPAWLDRYEKGMPYLGPLTPPLTSTVNARSPEQLQAVIAQFITAAPRYLPRDLTGDGIRETFCNFYTRDISRAMNCPLPEPMRANDFPAWLSSAGARVGWRRVDERAARAAAQRGEFAVAIWINNHGPGHIVPLLPGDGLKTWCSHVGGSHFDRGTLVQAFGAHVAELEFWSHS